MKTSAEAFLHCFFGIIFRQLFAGFILVCGLLAWFGNPNQLQAEVIAYPVPPRVEASPDYQVRADNQNIFVHITPVLSFASFALNGDAEIVLDVHRPIKKPVIRPLALGIKATVEGNTLRFHISHPCHLVVEVDEDLRRPLFLFADAPENNAPKAGDGNVRYFEGGKIYEAGTIQLKDNETVYLAGGAIVRGVIRAKNVTGARILGPGILDASIRPDKAKMMELNCCTNIEMDGLIVLGSYGWTLVPEFSEDIYLRNLKVLGWRDNDDGVDVVSSRRVTVDNCIFRTKDDCIAVKALVNSGVSTIAANNFEPVAPPLNSIGPSESNVEDVRIKNSIFWSSPLGHALTIGVELRAAHITNIQFHNCDIIKKEKGPAMSIDNGDFGLVEKVHFEDIRVEEGCEKLLVLQVLFAKYSGDCPYEYARRNANRLDAAGTNWLALVNKKRSMKRGAIRDVLLKHVTILGEQMPDSEFRGWNSDADISHVVFDGIIFQGNPVTTPAAANLKVQNATNITFTK